MISWSWWYHDDIIMTIASWWYHHDDIIMMISSWRYHHDDIIMMISSWPWWYHHDDIIIWVGQLTVHPWEDCSIREFLHTPAHKVSGSTEFVNSTGLKGTGKHPSCDRRPATWQYLYCAWPSVSTQERSFYTPRYTPCLTHETAPALSLKAQLLQQKTQKL